MEEEVWRQGSVGFRRTLSTWLCDDEVQETNNQGCLSLQSLMLSVCIPRTQIGQLFSGFFLCCLCTYGNEGPKLWSSILLKVELILCMLMI